MRLRRYRPLVLFRLLRARSCFATPNLVQMIRVRHRSLLLPSANHAGQVKPSVANLGVEPVFQLATTSIEPDAYACTTVEDKSTTAPPIPEPSLPVLLPNTVQTWFVPRDN